MSMREVGYAISFVVGFVATSVMWNSWENKKEKQEAQEANKPVVINSTEQKESNLYFLNNKEEDKSISNPFQLVCLEGIQYWYRSGLHSSVLTVKISSTTLHPETCMIN